MWKTARGDVLWQSIRPFERGPFFRWANAFGHPSSMGHINELGAQENFPSQSQFVEMILETR